MILLNMRIRGTDIPTKFTLYLTIINSYTVTISIVLDQFSHSVTLLNPRDDTDLIANIGNRVALD